MTRPEELDARARFLRAAVGFCLLPPTEPELRLLNQWPDSWRGVGDVVAIGRWVAAAGVVARDGVRELSAELMPSRIWAVPLSGRTLERGPAGLRAELVDSVIAFRRKRATRLRAAWRLAVPTLARGELRPRPVDLAVALGVVVHSIEALYGSPLQHERV